MCSSTPDTTLQQQAAMKTADLSAEQLAWMKEVYADTAPDRAAAAERAKTVSDAQLKSMGLQDAVTQQYIDDRGKFRTLENDIVDEANAYDTPEKRAQKSGEAMSSVSTQFDQGRAAMLRNASSQGFNTNSGAYIDSLAKTGVTEAAAKAAAGNTAVQQVETIGAAKKADAANLGRNLASGQATSASLALNQGNSAVNTSNQGLAATTSGIPAMQQGFSTAINGNTAAGNLYGQAAQIENSSNNSGLWGAIGNIGGALIKTSDKNQKKNIKPVSGKMALSAARKTPVKSWKYKGDSPAYDGNKTHVGPMAQDVHKNMGEKAAPGGKSIDLITMNGMTLAAVRQLDKEVQGIKKQLKRA